MKGHLDTAAAAMSTFGGFAFWVLLGFPYRCPELTELVCSEKVTVLGVHPIFGSLEAASMAALLLTVVLYGAAAMLPSRAS